MFAVCVSGGRKCVNCVSSYHGRCQNLSAGSVEEECFSLDTTDNTVCLAGAEIVDIIGHEGPVHSSPVRKSPDESDAGLMKAFWATLVIDCHENLDDAWYCRWKRVIGARSIHYDLPGGATGRHLFICYQMKYVLLAGESLSLRGRLFFSQLCFNVTLWSRKN